MVHRIGTVGLKIFDDLKFFHHNMNYVPEFRRNLLSISMFDDLGYCARVGHEVLKILHGEMIMLNVRPQF